jgi:RNA polymerase sigma-70 factor, ECF subfamily
VVVRWNTVDLEQDERTAPSGSPASSPVAQPVNDGGFERFYRAEWASVVRLAWALTGSRAIAEELAQDAFSSAHDRWHRVGSMDQPGAWVRRVVVNRALSSLRRWRAEQRALDRLGQPTSLAIDALDGPAEELWAAVRRLPTRQAQVVALVTVEQRTLRDAGAVLGIAEDTARTHYRRALATLAVALGDQEDER